LAGEIYFDYVTACVASLVVDTLGKAKH